MDNASFHQRHDMLEAISANQCQAEFLPPDSPDLNPIEDKWAQAKAVRRRYRCGIDELFSEHSQYVFYNDLAIRHGGTYNTSDNFSAQKNRFQDSVVLYPFQ